MARAWLRRRGRRALLVPVPVPFRWAAGFRAGLNTCPQQRTGGLTWEAWLDRRDRPRAGTLFALTTAQGKGRTA
jgi:hypothetical protein